jgi:uncharacterized protein
VSVTEVLALVAVGTAAGIVSTVVSIASIVSYPSLLALGLPPLTANMTNTFALLFTGAGAAAGSRPELAGQAARIRRLAPVSALGGGAGAALLLVTPADTFQRVAPVLIGGASLVLLAPFRRAGQERAAGDGASAGEGPQAGAGGPAGAGPYQWPLVATLFGVSVYIGYFGAAGGILMFAVLTAMLAEPVARANAVKNILNGVANSVAAVAFAILGHVDWAVVPPLAAGFLAGGWTGPALARRLPARVLRTGVAVCGLAVAVKLGIDAYT